MYSSIIKLKKALGDKAELLLNGIEDSELTDILTDSSNVIDSYIKTVIPLPLNEANAMLDQICLSLAKAEIYRRFASNDLPKDVSEQESKAYKDLEKIQQKKIIVVAQDNPENDTNFTAKPVNFNVFME